MRRVILLALLALALPTAALASSIDYAGFATTTPATVTGSVSSGAIDLTFHQLGINGGAATAGTVDISVTGTSCGTGCLTITGGTVTIMNASNTTLFKGTFSSGTVMATSGPLTTLSISGLTTGGVTIAGVVKVSGFGWFGSSNTVVTPEPGTLGLLGTGLIGLAGIVRKKVRG
jgi:PEP-CTERM motif